MSDLENYIEINKKLWNDKTKIHIKSEFYNNKKFLITKQSLNPLEIDLLGDIKNKSILHLQCHFGQDSISLANMGAEVTGIDLSDAAINEAKLLAKQVEVDLEFICSNIYDLPKVLNRKYDIVFTSYGTIGWLPDLDKWAKVVDNFLKPGGEFLIVEFHPVVWMFDDQFSKIEYSYFNTNAIIEEIKGTYADFNADIINKSVTWNHPIDEVISSLLKVNLQITHFKEYDFSPYPCFRNVYEVEKDKYRIKGLDDKIPMIFSLKAGKKQD